MARTSKEKPPSQERFASLYFPDVVVLNGLKSEAEKRHSSFNKLCVEILTQCELHMRAKRSKGVNAKTFKITITDRV